MERFGKASGLKVNTTKSRAYFSKGVPTSVKDRLASMTSIRNTGALDKYLAFPILKGRLKNSDFLFIIDKMQSRLASWKAKLLNKPGRLALANSVLASIPYYYMQTVMLPAGVTELIDKITRQFLWKGNNDRGFNLVSWSVVTKPRKWGGLGLRRAKDANMWHCLENLFGSCKPHLISCGFILCQKNISKIGVYLIIICLGDRLFGIPFLRLGAL